MFGASYSREFGIYLPMKIYPTQFCRPPSANNRGLICQWSTIRNISGADHIVFTGRVRWHPGSGFTIWWNLSRGGAQCAKSCPKTGPLLLFGNGAPSWSNGITCRLQISITRVRISGWAMMLNIGMAVWFSDCFIIPLTPKLPRCYHLLVYHRTTSHFDSITYTIIREFNQ